MNPDTGMSALEVIAWIIVPAIVVGYGVIRLGRRNRHPGMDDQIMH